VNPVGFFGMVLVLEGTSVTTADLAASAIQKALKLPDSAFTYLRSHGAIDQDHIQFFEDLMNRVSAEEDQQQIIHSARMFFRLYADIFRSIPNHVSLAA
jgi:heme oxygenase